MSCVVVVSFGDERKVVDCNVNDTEVVLQTLASVRHFRANDQVRLQLKLTGAMQQIEESIVLPTLRLPDKIKASVFLLFVLLR